MTRERLPNIPESITMNLKQTPVALLFAALLFAAALFAASPAWAGEGHDHGAAPAATGTAKPRFVAVSETFELVGVLNGTQLTLYLDRFADNAPVRGATLELEIGGVKVAAQPRADGEFTAVLAAVPTPGVLPVMATVVAGVETDLLAGELDLHEASKAAAAVNRRGWQAWAGWAIGGLVTLSVLVWAGRMAMARRTVSGGGAA